MIHTLFPTLTRASLAIACITNLRTTGTRTATALHLRTRTLSDMDPLDRRLYTSPHAPTDTVARVGPDRVKLARNRCMLQITVRLSLSRYCTHQPHPCTVLTATHHIHTRPQDVPARLAYQRLLVNTYCTFDLCRPHDRARPPSASCDRRAFALTRSSPDVDLPGFGSACIDMSAQEDDQGSWSSRRLLTPYC